MNENGEKSFEFFLVQAKKVLSGIELESFETPTDPLWTNILSRTVKSSKLTKTVRFFKQKLTEKAFKSFLKSSDNFGVTLLHEMCRDYDADCVKCVLDHIVGNLELDEIKAFIFLKLTTRKNALGFAASNINERVFETLWNFFEEKLYLEEQTKVLEDNESIAKILNHAAGNVNKESFKKVAQILEKKIGNEMLKENILKDDESIEKMFFQSHKDLKDHGVEMLWNYTQDLFDDETLKKLLVKKNIKRESLMQRVLKRKDDKMLEIFEPFIVRTCTDNESFETFLLWLEVASFYPIEFIAKLASIVDRNTQLVASFYSKLFNFQHETHGHIFASARRNENFLKVLTFFVEKSRNFLDENQLEPFLNVIKTELRVSFINEILHTSFKNEFEMSTRHLAYKKLLGDQIFKKLLMSTDEDGQTLLQKASWPLHNDQLPTLLRIVQENLRKDEIKESIRQKNRIGQTTFMFAAEKAGKEGLKNLWNFIENNFDVEEQNEALLEKDEKGYSTLHFALSNSQTCFEFVKRVFEEKFGIEETKKLLKGENTNGETILSHLIDKFDLKEFEKFWTKIREMLDDKILKKLLLQRNQSMRREKTWLGKHAIADHVKVFEPFIIKTCTDNESTETFFLLLDVAEFYSVDFVCELFSVVDQNKTAASFYENLFQFEDENRKTIIDRAILNKHKIGMINVLMEKATALHD